jgi:hypothetical protein
MVKKTSSVKKNDHKQPKIFVSKSAKLNLKPLKNNLVRVDLELLGLDHSGPSYEGRIFINNPDADQNTATIKKNGYVGSYHIFGHGGCFGGMEHCLVKNVRRPYDFRPSSPLTPIYKRVEITEHILGINKFPYVFGVTIVPLLAKGYKDWFVHMDTENVIKLEKIMIKTYGKIA